MKIPVTGSTMDIAGWVWNNLVPSSGQSESVQGEILRSIEKLRWEAQNNGNGNWDDGFERIASFLEGTLGRDAGLKDSNRAAVLHNMQRLRQHDDPYLEDDLYDQLTDVLAEFCQVHPEVIPHASDPDLHR